jgi:hypothetical protein
VRFFILFTLLSTALSAKPLSFEQRGPDHFQSWDLSIRPTHLTGFGIDLRFIGAAPGARVEGLGTSSPATYYNGANRYRLRQFPRVAIRGLYPRIDAVFYGETDHLEYDLVAAPGANLSRIRLQFSQPVRLDGADIVAGGLRQRAPHVFQANGKPVAAWYVILGPREIGLRVDPYDRHQQLTIDPELAFTKYFGGSGVDTATAVATDAHGNVYIAGTTTSADFPGGRMAAPLAVISGQPQTEYVNAETTILAIGGTSDGRLLYAFSPTAAYLSTDGGANWTLRGSLPAQIGRINSVSVDEIDPSRMFVATSTALLSSFDGGRTWEHN